MTSVSILLAVMGFAIRYLLNRQAFNRRNAVGVGEFSSYEAAAGTQLVEGLGVRRLLAVRLVLAGATYFVCHQ